MGHHQARCMVAVASEKIEKFQNTLQWSALLVFSGDRTTGVGSRQRCDEKVTSGERVALKLRDALSRHSLGDRSAFLDDQSRSPFISATGEEHHHHCVDVDLLPRALVRLHAQPISQLDRHQKRKRKTRKVVLLCVNASITILSALFIQLNRVSGQIVLFYCAYTLAHSLYPDGTQVVERELAIRWTI